MKSGMGDCPEFQEAETQEDKERLSNTTVYSSKFFGFCMKGDSLNASLAYTYTLLIKQQDGLLEPAQPQAEMPTSANLGWRA